VWYSSDLEILPFLFKVLGEIVLIKMLENHSITYSSIGEQLLPKPNMISCKFQAFHIRYLLFIEFGRVFQDQNHVHPHMYAALTLEVRKNMLPFRPTKNSAPTLGVDKIRLLGKYSIF